MTDAAAKIVWRADVGTFDRKVVVDTIGGLNVGFPGQYYDTETVYGTTGTAITTPRLDDTCRVTLLGWREGRICTLTLAETR